METTGKNTSGRAIYPNKSNEEVEASNRSILIKKKPIGIFVDSTNNDFITYQSKNPQFQASTKFGTKCNKVQAMYNERNSKQCFGSCRSNTNESNGTKSKLLLNRVSDENKPCSSQNAYGNYCMPSADRQLHGYSNSNVSSFTSNDLFNNSSPPTEISSIEPENKCIQGVNDDSSLVEYYGHWLEIKDENMEEIKEKYMPESEDVETGEEANDLTNEIYCKSTDLNKGWSHFLPGQKCESTNLKRCKDKCVTCCVQYSQCSCSDGFGEEHRVTDKRETLSVSSICSDKVPASVNQGNNTVLTLVADSNGLNNKEICNRPTVSFPSEFVGSWLEIEDKNKEISEHIIIPDQSRPVKGVSSRNEAVQVVNTKTVDEIPFTSRENGDNFTNPLMYANKGFNVLSKTNKQNSPISEDNCIEKAVKVIENTHQAIVCPTSTYKNLALQVNYLTEKNSLSDFDFFSTDADVEKDEYCTVIRGRFDSLGGHINVSEKYPKSKADKHLIQAIHTKKEKPSLYLRRVEQCATNKLLNTSETSGNYKRVLWQCFTCHLLFESSSLLKRHRIFHKHLDPNKPTNSKKDFKETTSSKYPSQRDVRNQFKCPTCKIEFPYRDLLEGHISTHFVDCRTCGQTCTSEYALKCHLKKLHSEKCFLCSECDESFVSSENRRNHVRSCHSDKYPKFTCSLCKSSYVKKCSLVEHLLTHLGEKKFFCSDCGEGFVLQRRLKCHMTKHITEKLWNCSLCSKQFKTRRYLTIHMKAHTAEKHHKCADCGRSFQRFSNLRCHMQLHAGEKKFHCEICKRSFFSKPSLMMHMAKHLSGQPMSKHVMKCMICCLDKRHFKTSLKTHLKQHTLRPKDMCKVKFDCYMRSKPLFKQSKRSSHYHLNLHRNGSYFKRVKRKTTSRNFVNLLCHSYLHLRTKKFLCNVCGDEFSLMKGLMEHMKVHSGKNPYKCSICKQRFPEHFILVRHLEQHVEKRRLHSSVA